MHVSELLPILESPWV